MKKILLTQGKFALVDDADFEWLNQWKWCLYKCGRWEYAKRRGGDGKIIIMHRLIMGLEPGDGQQVDHIDGNRSDNRRCNLRICTNRQNAQNSRSRGGKSKYKGVSWYKPFRKWRARIVIDSKETCLGYFENELDAATAYDSAALKYFGEFALTNFELVLA